MHKCPAHWKIIGHHGVCQKYLKDIKRCGMDKRKLCPWDGEKDFEFVDIGSKTNWLRVNYEQRNIKPKA